MTFDECKIVIFNNIILMKNIGNFPEKCTGNFPKFFGKICSFPDNFSASHHYQLLRSRLIECLGVCGIALNWLTVTSRWASELLGLSPHFALLESHRELSSAPYYLQSLLPQSLT